MTRAFPDTHCSVVSRRGDIGLGKVDYVVFYDKPLVKFERLLETHLTYAPRGFRSLIAAMPVWLKEKLYLKHVLKKELSELDEYLGLVTGPAPPVVYRTSSGSRRFGKSTFP